ncbi:ASCH domain-containing protein [Dysgonomonas sp. GY75]|uniref:ASCH domain-containing protein n=1 Tax=Dysgonomonas sp. GY75 TaxID=2780419 RepID=UPI001884388B|nr:ASCH domain-containing protein [Dysgonomonas sp. GY75]MBF0651310.1 ASCH domain-containing protein [Dysgonomonas sp. GY75]
MNKAISIKQPWAYLICAGIKDVENRTWDTKYRGRVYIHASVQLAKTFDFTLEQSRAIDCIPKYQKTFMRSAIIGHVDIVNCISKVKNGKGSDSIWAEPDCFHWILRNPVLFDEPILNVKGKLSFWDCSEYLK